MGNWLKAEAKTKKPEAKTKKLDISNFEVNHMYLVETSDETYKKCFVLITAKDGPWFIGKGRFENASFDVKMRRRSGKKEEKAHEDWKSVNDKRDSSLGYFWSGDRKKYQLYTIEGIEKRYENVNPLTNSKKLVKTVDGEEHERSGRTEPFANGSKWFWMNPRQEEVGVWGVVVEIYKSSDLQKALQKTRGEIPMEFKQFRF